MDLSLQKSRAVFRLLSSSSRPPRSRVCRPEDPLKASLAKEGPLGLVRDAFTLQARHNRSRDLSLRAHSPQKTSSPRPPALGKTPLIIEVPERINEQRLCELPRISTIDLSSCEIASATGCLRIAFRPLDELQRPRRALPLMENVG